MLQRRVPHQMRKETQLYSVDGFFFKGKEKMKMRGECGGSGREHEDERRIWGVWKELKEQRMDRIIHRIQV